MMSVSQYLFTYLFIQETEDLVEAVQKEISRIEEVNRLILIPYCNYCNSDLFLYPYFSTFAWVWQTQAWSSSHSWSTPVENMQIAENPAADRVEIPTDGSSEWEIDVKLLKFGNKVASGSYGDL